MPHGPEGGPSGENLTAREIVELMGDVLKEKDREFLTEGIAGEDEEADRQFVLGFVMFALEEGGQNAEEVLVERGVIQGFD